MKKNTSIIDNQYHNIMKIIQYLKIKLFLFFASVTRMENETEIHASFSPEVKTKPPKN